MSGDTVEVALAWRSSIGVFVDSYRMSRVYTVEPGECDVLLTGAEMVHAYISARKLAFFGLFPHDISVDAIGYRAGDVIVNSTSQKLCVGGGRQGSVFQLSNCQSGEEPRPFNVWMNADAYNPIEFIFR